MHVNQNNVVTFRIKALSCRIMEVHHVVTLGLFVARERRRRGCPVIPPPLHPLSRSRRFSHYTFAQKANRVIKLPPKSPQSLSLILSDMRPKRKWFSSATPPAAQRSPRMYARRTRNVCAYILYTRAYTCVGTFYFLPSVDTSYA